jgi:phenylalanine-4-hydroxylase
MSFKIGGSHGLDVAKTGRTVVTVELNSDIGVSGKVTEYQKDGDQITFVKLSGPVQISYEGCELKEQGTKQHPDGFSCPIGFWKKAPTRLPHALSESELKDLGIEIGQHKVLEFTSGFKVTGDIIHLERKDSKLILIKWKNCSLTSDGKVFFDPSWGDFDMLVGTIVSSVFGGAADREKYGNYKLGETKTSPKRTSKPSVQEQKTYQTFQKSRELRETLKKGVYPDTAQKIIGFAAECEQNFETNWLLRLEALELLALTAAAYTPVQEDFGRSLKAYLADYKKFDQGMLPYIEHALGFIHEN